MVLYFVKYRCGTQCSGRWELGDSGTTKNGWSTREVDGDIEFQGLGQLHFLIEGEEFCCDCRKEETRSVTLLRRGSEWILRSKMWGGKYFEGAAFGHFDKSCPKTGLLPSTNSKVITRSWRKGKNGRDPPQVCAFKEVSSPCSNRAAGSGEYLFNQQIFIKFYKN